MKKNNDTIIKFWQFVSSVSTGYAIQTLVSNGTSDTIILNSSLAMGFAIGGTIAYKVIPELIESGAKPQALILGTLLSLTYPMNAMKIHDIIVEFKASEIDKRYNHNKEEYSTYNITEYKSSTKIVDLNNTYLIEKEKVEQLNGSVSLKQIKNSVSLEVGEVKSSKSASEYKAYYTKLARANGCTLPISFNRLVKCVSKAEFRDKSVALESKVRTAKSDMAKAKLELQKAIAKDETLKQKANQSSGRVAELKKAIDSTRAKAEDEAVNVFMIAGLLWAFGLFIEVFIIGFEILKEMWREKNEEQHIVKSVEKVSKELEKVSSEYRKILHNYEGMDYIIDFANNQNHSLRKALAWKSGNRKGKAIALSNSIAGAFLYVLTLRKEEDQSVNSWEDLSQADILFVNGRNGTESVNGKKRLKLIDEFLGNVSNKNILCLGSTAETIRIKNFGEVCPQKEAISYLIEKERVSKLRFAPQNITPADIELLAIDFTRKFYPKQFQ